MLQPTAHVVQSPTFLGGLGGTAGHCWCSQHFFCDAHLGHRPVTGPTVCQTPQRQMQPTVAACISCSCRWCCTGAVTSDLKLADLGLFTAEIEAVLCMEPQHASIALDRSVKLRCRHTHTAVSDQQPLCLEEGCLKYGITAMQISRQHHAWATGRAGSRLQRRQKADAADNPMLSNLLRRVKPGACSIMERTGRGLGQALLQGRVGCTACQAALIQPASSMPTLRLIVCTCQVRGSACKSQARPALPGLQGYPSRGSAWKLPQMSCSMQLCRCCTICLTGSGMQAVSKLI